MKQEHIGQKILHLARDIDRKLAQEVSQYGLSNIQGRILNFVYHESSKRDVFQKDIEEKFHIRGSSVTSVLNLMEKNEIIKRITSSEDGRLKKIVLLDKGNQLYHNVHLVLIDMENQLAESLTEEEQDTLVTLLDKLSNHLKD